MNILKTKGIKLSAILLFFFTLSFSSSAYAGIDTTLFRINVVQDSVHVGDTVDVDFFIGGGGILGLLNILKSFEIEVATDTSLMVEDNIKFKLDSTSLESFFGVLISSITTITTIDPILGKLNIKTNSNSTGNGNARVGRGKYIVQDNVAGRQYMHYDFTKAISKDLLGFNNPVKTVIDSVLIIGRDIGTPTAIKTTKNNKIKLSPNPVRDFINVEGEKVQRYKVLDINGNEALPENKSALDNIQLNLNKLNNGTYILMLQIDNSWNSYKVVKE